MVKTPRGEGVFPQRGKANKQSNHSDRVAPVEDISRKCVEVYASINPLIESDHAVTVHLISMGFPLSGGLRD